MRIETTGADLRAAINWAGRIVPTRPMLPVLGGVLLDAAEGGASISATDLNLFGTARLTGAVVKPGRAVVSAALLGRIAEVICKGKVGEVSIVRTDRGRVEIRAGRSSWGLPEIDTANWPEHPDPGEALGTIAAPQLRRGLARVLPAAADDKTPPLQAVAFVPGETLTLAATDRYRLAVAEVDTWVPKGDSTEQLVVPVTQLRPALDALKGSAGDVTLYADGATLTLECGPTRITGSLLAGFVQWQSVRPKPELLSATVVLVETAELAAKADGAALVCKAEEAIHLALHPDEIRITPDGQRDDSDEDADQPAEVLSFTGRPAAILVSPRYLADALAAVDEPLLELRFGDPHAPTVTGRGLLLRPATSNGVILDGYEHVLMLRGRGKSR